MTVEIAVHRSYDVPAQRIYDAWTDVAQLRDWLCPGGSFEGEVRVGAPYVMMMLYEGQLYRHSGRFLRLEPPKLVEFSWVSEKGTYDTETIVRVDITDLGPGCEMTLTHMKLPDQKQAEGHRFGWSELAGILAKHVGGR